MKVRQLIVVMAIVGAVASLVAAVAAARIQPRSDWSIATAERLRVMLLASNELPGYWAIDCPTVLTTAVAWAPHDSTTTTALRSEGFVMGIRESLMSGPRGFTATSEAVNFHSAAGARRDVVRQLVAARTVGVTWQLSVPGIPGASGWVLFTHSRVSYHVMFSVRNDEYGVALAGRPGASRSYSEGEAAVIAAAAGIFARAS